MSVNAIPASTLKFLKALEKNNNRDWFTKNKPWYQEEYDSFKAFAATLHDKMNQVDNIERMRVHRIYRDVRFSKDKTPYKSHFSGGMSRATKLLRGGYYFHIQPGHSFLAGGFWAPNSPDLKRIRKEIEADDKPLRKIIANKNFKKMFGNLVGDSVKTAPKGFDRNHPAIDLIRRKQFLVMHSFTDKEVCSKNFVDKVVKGYLTLRPFFDYMSEVLTTDENGVPIV